MSIFIIAEIGINHNGDLDIARKLIDVAALAGSQVSPSWQAVQSPRGRG